MHAYAERLRARLPPRMRAAVDLVVATVKDSGTDRITGLASEIAFWVLLSLPAVSIAVVSLAGLLDPVMGSDTRVQSIERIEEIAGQVFRQETVDDVIAAMLDRLLIDGSPSVFSISFVVAVFTASRILRVVVVAITIAYDLHEERPTWMARILGLLFSVIGLLLGVLLVPMVVAGPQLGYILERRWGLEALPLGEIWTTAYWPVAVVVLTLVIAALFHWATPRRTPFHRDLPGAVLATVAGLAISALLRLYTTNAFGADAVYAPLAAPLAILVWVWLVAIGLLVGAELNSEIEKAHPSNGWPPPRRRTPAEIGAQAVAQARRMRAVDAGSTDGRRLIRTAALVVASWLAGAAVVRLGLDAVDRRAYSATSEVLYLAVAMAALGVAVGGTWAAVSTHRRREASGSPAGLASGMRMVTLRSANAPVAATFVPEAGMIGISLTDDGVELLGQRRGFDTYVSAGKTMGIPILYPWANRLSADEFDAAGQHVEIAADAVGVRTDPNGLPIHGLLAAHPDWRVVTERPDELVATFDFAAHPELLASFPFPHTVVVSVVVRARTLTIRTEVTASGEVDVPLCYGFHPYLQLPGTDRAAWEIETPAMRHLGVDDRGLPDGRVELVPARRETLGEKTFDDGYDQVADGSVFAVAVGGRRVEVAFIEGFPAAQIFAPPGEALICFEPMAAPTDALTRGGFAVARPGEPAVSRFSITV